MFGWRSPRVVWPAAIALPFILQLIEIPFERRYGDFISGASFMGNIAAYYGPILLPSYVLLASMPVIRFVGAAAYSRGQNARQEGDCKYEAANDRQLDCCYRSIAADQHDSSTGTSAGRCNLARQRSTYPPSVLSIDCSSVPNPAPGISLSFSIEKNNIPCAIWRIRCVFDSSLFTSAHSRIFLFRVFFVQ